MNLYHIDAIVKELEKLPQACYHLSRATENTEEAIALCQKGLQEISSNFMACGLFNNPAIESIFHEQAALILFQQKITLLEQAYLESKDPVFLEKGP